MIAMIMMFFAGSAFGFISSIEVALILLLILLVCVLLTLAVSKLLSLTVAKGAPSGFALELPPYRKPQIIKTIVRSLLDRTLFVLGRAVIVAAPAGAVIWLTANIRIGDCSILQYCTDFLDPFGRFIGLDGVIVMAFILGFPANETVIPIIIMSYMASGTLMDYSGYPELLRLFSANGWTVTTAVCMMVMTVLDGNNCGLYDGYDGITFPLLHNLSDDKERNRKPEMDADVNVTSNVDGSNHLRRNCKYSKAVLTKKYAEMSSVTSPRLFILLINFCSASDAEFFICLQGLSAVRTSGCRCRNGDFFAAVAFRS